MEKFDWKILGVFNSKDDPEDERVIPFAYTIGLFENYGLPELRGSMQGECGHMVAYEGLCYILNLLGRKLVNNDITPGMSHGEAFIPTNAILTFTLGQPEEGVDPDKYQTYQVSHGAPIIAVSWRCCDRELARL